MSRKTEVQAAIAALQGELTVLNRIPDDTFNIGTVLVFASNNNTVRSYIRKADIEIWATMTDSPVFKDLPSHISDALHSPIGYFEVYELRVQPSPFFTSS